MEVRLKVENLKIGYKLNNKVNVAMGPTIHFNAYASEIVMLIGPNGIGKSTLLRTLNKLIPALDGRILINNININDLTIKELASLMAYVSTVNIFPFNLTIEELVALGRTPYLNWTGRLSYTDNKIIDESLELFGLTALRKKSLDKVSDGERQRALIARAYAQQTPIIILDEPTAFLDVYNKYHVVRILSDIAHKKHKTIILSIHDLTLALNEADKIMLFVENEIIQGAPEDLIIKDSISKIFKHQLQYDVYSGTVKNNKSIVKTIALIDHSYQKPYLKITAKALERYGVACNQNDEYEEKIFIEPNNHTAKWVYYNNDTKAEFFSIYDLIRFIRSVTLKY